MVDRETGGTRRNKLLAALMRLRVLVLLTVLLATLLAGITLFGAHASTCAEWEHCPLTQRYGHNQEHGVDVWTQGLPVTALRSGTITLSQEECWSGECVMDISGKLDSPSQAGGSPSMSVQIRTSSVHVGEQVADGDLLGSSGSFLEVGLTPDWAYGVSNWRWGVNMLSVFPWL